MAYEVKIEGYDAIVATAGSRKLAEQTAAASLLTLLQGRTWVHDRSKRNQ
jgi:uncharacterized membrane protein (DUF4010 family)